MTPGLKQRFLQAAGWMVFGHVLGQLVRFASSLILTRLLAPELYGVMSVGYAIMTGLSMFSDLGLSAGAIRSTRGDDPRFLNVSWVVQIARGLVIALGALAAAAALKLTASAGWFPAHSVYADPLVPGLVAVISLFALVSGFESTKVWYARRHLEMAALTKIELLCQVATTGFQITWALIDPSIWTLAGGWIFGSLVRTTLSHLWLKGPSNKFEWDSAIFHEVFHFGKWVFLSSAFTFLLNGGDMLLLGGFLDTKTLGAYSIAVMLIGTLQVAVLKIVGYTVLPALGEVHRERPEQLQATIYRIRRPLDIVCLVPAGAMLVLGEPIVHLLYDDRYAAAGWMLGAMSLTLVLTRLDVFDQCLVAIGRVKLLSLLNGLRLIALYGLVPIGFHLYGAAGAVYAVAASALVNSAVILMAQARLNLLDLRQELVAIPLFAGGAAVGWALLSVVRAFT